MALTATPILRTLQMSLIGIRDLSVIETPPVDRLSIRTYVTRFDEDIIRQDLRTTLTIARDCNVELIMKDVHTLCDQPQRMARWVEIAREESAA